MQYQAIPRNTMLYHATPSNVIRNNAITYKTIQYHAIPCNTMQYLATPHKTMQNNAITCNTNLISWSLFHSQSVSWTQLWFLHQAILSFRWVLTSLLASHSVNCAQVEGWLLGNINYQLISFYEVTFCPEYPVQNKQPCHYVTKEVGNLNAKRRPSFKVKVTFVVVKMGTALINFLLCNV